MAIDYENIYNNHGKRLNKYSSKVEGYFDEATKEVLRLVQATDIDTSKTFTLDDYPRLKNKVIEVIKDLYTKLYREIKSGTSDEWDSANKTTDSFIKSILGDDVINNNNFADYFNRNLEALNAFQSRKTLSGGLDLSKRIWKYLDQYRYELELSLEISIGKGLSAATTAKQVKQYLKEPDKLFRRVRDEKGNLQQSKAAKLYNPGAGVYKSSYQNALRLARTEINMAYRLADWYRWQTLDFVIGIEIRLSNNHTIKDSRTGEVRPLKDICDELIGRYPKTFKFTGWHPNCRCIALPIIQVDKEFMQQLRNKINNGESIKPRTINKYPTQFKDWVETNRDKIEKAKSRGTLPYWLRDNMSVIDSKK